MNIDGWSRALSEMHEEESDGRNPIDVASRARCIYEVRRHVGDRAATILEVGSGGGHLVRELRETMPQANVFGSDPIAKTDHPWTIETCPIEGSVDVLVALNVLEHIKDDVAAARHIRRILRPGGMAYIELPACPSLFDVHDRVLMHHRRYTLAGASRLFREAGFRIERASHLGAFVWPVFAVKKMLGKRHLHASAEAQRDIVAKSIRGTRVSSLMALAMELETVCGEVAWPFGVRVVLTAINETKEQVE
jgi:SAM-dependent methyltransferase